MEWKYQNEPVTDEQVDGLVGFVYIITHIPTGKRYIGKKRLQKRRKLKALKGKKRRRTEITASDWRDYWGSSKSLLVDIEKFGKEQFKREIIHLCKTLGEASYYEAREQFVNDVLLSDQWYNDWIMCRVRKDHLKHLHFS
jgi:hypothetical protein